MTSARARLGLAALTASALLSEGCFGGDRYPTTTRTSSERFAGSLEKKQAFLQRYLTFRRSYERLEFHISYWSDDGLIGPSRSKWDLRVAATVPEDELSQWTAGLERCASPPDLGWIQKIPSTSTKTAGFRWHCDLQASPGGGERRTQRVVGVQPQSRAVLYRNWGRNSP